MAAINPTPTPTATTCSKQQARRLINAYLDEEDLLLHVRSDDGKWIPHVNMDDLKSETKQWLADGALFDYKGTVHLFAVMKKIANIVFDDMGEKTIWSVFESHLTNIWHATNWPEDKPSQVGRSATMIFHDLVSARAADDRAHDLVITLRNLEPRVTIEWVVSMNSDNMCGESDQLEVQDEIFDADGEGDGDDGGDA